MQALDDNLLDQLIAVHAEIARTEQAEPPIEVAIVARLAEAERAAVQFRAAPFQLGSDVATPIAIRRMVTGAMLALLPDATAQLIEAHTREVEQQRAVLRMTEQDKSAKLIELRDKAKRIEAKLELLRREIEQDDPDATFPRTGDPAVWLASGAELAAMTAGGGRRR